jgi:hypothetical protein
MRTHHYPSDVTHAQWALIEPHLPPEPGDGRPRETDMRDVFDAILDILRTGCPWGDLPATCRPGAPSGGTSISGGTTAPSTRFMTRSVARSAPGRSRTTPGPPPAP